MPGRLVKGLLAVAAAAAACEAMAGSPVLDLPGTTGVVVYSDEDWHRAFVLRDAGPPFALPAGIVPLPVARRRVEMVGGSKVHDRGPAALPEALPQPPGPAAGLLWVSLEATVRAVVRGEETHTFLRVLAAGRALDVHVPSPLRSAAEPAPHPGARLRLRGVLEPPADAWSRPRLWVADWSEAVVVRPAAEWDGVRLSTVAEARRLATGAGEDEIRVAGRAVARRSARSFTIASGDDAITADLDHPEHVREGATIEVRGFAVMRGGAPVLADARWRTVGVSAFSVSHRESGLPLLQSVVDVRALARAEAERGYPVRLEAMVTYVSDRSGRMWLEDATGGIYVHAPREAQAVAAGDRVRLEGFTAPGGLAPMVVDGVATRLARAALPAAPRVSTTRLAAGFDDCRRIETSGHVRRVSRDSGETTIVLGIEGLRVPVHLPLEVDDDALPPVDARVRVAGVCGTAFNWRSLFDHVELFVASPGDLVVEERSADPFDLPLVPVRDILRSPGGRWERLVRTRGTVLHQRQGQPLFLRSDTGTVIVETSRAEPLVSGDEIDVVGFPAPGATAPRLEDATFRRVGAGPPPEPLAAGGTDLLGQSRAAELVRLRGTVIQTVRHESGSMLVLKTATDVVKARAAGDLQPPPPDRAMVEVTGILLPHDPGTGNAELDLVLRSPGDVRIVARAPWLTPDRTGRALAGLAAAALLAFAWVATLRRRVAARTAELAAAEERYRLLADNASDVIVTTDAGLRLTYVSPSVTRDIGYSAEEALALSLERIVTPESWALVRSALERAGEQPGDEPLELGIEMVRKDGSRRFMHVRARPMRDESGRLTGYCAAARDVTARRQAEQERARLATAIAQSADAIVLTDPNGAILYVNPAFERVTGYAAAEVLGGNPSVLKSGAHDRAFYEAMWATLQAGETWEGRFTNRRKDGRLFLEDATISPVRDGEGGLIGYVAVKRDVTRQVQLEGQLAQAQKMEAIGRLAAGIAHDFNNVLAIILSLSDLALQRGDATERTRKCVDGIREAALRAGGLTRQILTFSRQSPAAIEPLDPRAVVGEAAGMLRHLVPRGVDVQTRLESTLRVAADPTQLHQVVLNLGTNAGLAMSATGGTVEVALEDARVDEAFAESHQPLRAGPCLRLLVRDRGCGMTAETLSHIFEPFFTTRIPRDGTGMGLAVVHGIVHRHGGAITVESEVGRGSTFSVFLPALPRSTRGDAAGSLRTN